MHPYAFIGLPAGLYDLVVGHAGFAIYRIQAIHLAEDDRKNLDPIVLSIGMCGVQRQDAIRELEQSSERGNISGAVHRKRNRGFPGVKVALICRDQSVCAVDTADANGRYHFLHLQPGDYAIRIQEKGYYEADLSVDVRAGFETLTATGLQRCPHGNCKIPRCCCE